MATGERIRFFRTLRGMTQKYLGRLLGFSEKSADVRLAQYESGDRNPKPEMVKQMAAALDVSPFAITVPDIDTRLGFYHTMFALEDLYGLKICTVEGQPHLYVDYWHSNDSQSFTRFLRLWAKQAQRLRDGEITKAEYDEWRYHFPEIEPCDGWVKVFPSPELDAMLNREYKKDEKARKR